MMCEHAWHTATLLNTGKILIVGGVDHSGATTTCAELYDPVAGTFSLTGLLNTDRYMHTATLLNDGTVLIVGGVQIVSGFGSYTLDSAELYDPVAGVFNPVGSLNTARYGHTATLMSDGATVFIAGGRDISGQALASTEKGNASSICGSTFCFRYSQSMATPRAWHTATTLLDGNTIMMAGGRNSTSGTLDSVELLNDNGPIYGFGVILGPYSAIGMNAARSGHTATLLTNGKVYIAGGWDYFGQTLSSAELLDTTVPPLANFVPTASFSTARSLHTATLLNDGTVLVTGGVGATGNALISTETYTPATLVLPTFTGNSYALIWSSPSAANTLMHISVGSSNTYGVWDINGQLTPCCGGLYWSSSNPAVASVTALPDLEGTVYGVTPGTAIITACNPSGPSSCVSIHVTVQ
jgi:hypothetical protein